MDEALKMVKSVKFIQTEFPGKPSQLGFNQKFAWGAGI